MDKDSIQQFTNEQFGKLRVIKDENGEFWFVATDVANALDYQAASKVLRLLDEDEKGIHNVDTPGGNQKLSIISEPGLYHAINLRRTGSVKDDGKKDRIKTFQHWVNHEVIPTIRKHGMYATPQTVEQMLQDPDTMIQTLQALKAEREERKRLEEQNEKLKVKAGYFDKVMEADGLLSVRNSAKLLKSYDKSMGQKKLFELLRKDGMVEKRTRHTTAKAIERGYMRERQYQYTGKDGSMKMRHYGCLTSKGLAWCVERYCTAQN